ncbi:MAG: hypothetical protein AB7P03_05165 [Kofleriaceae bacterium]
MLRPWLTFLAVVALGIGGARAQPNDAVALLPLDAPPRLEIYGQPVASEIARVLIAGGIDVVVVGPKMAVPARAKLIVDGTIAGTTSAILVTLRVRTPSDGVVIETLQSSATSITNIDRAAADLSAKVLPVVRDKLAAMHEPPARPNKIADRLVLESLPLTLLATTAAGAASEPLRAAMVERATTWSKAHRRDPRLVDAAQLAGKLAPITVKETGSELAIAFDVRSYSVTRYGSGADAVPMARARVRVRIANDSAVVFDRVVVTDTVVGDRAIAAPALASRTAREVLEILRPHLRRVVPSWR